MAVTPSHDTPVVTTQLRLLSGTELPGRHPRRRGTNRAASSARLTSPVVRLDARTRRIGQTGIAEARRRLAEISATSERAQELVQAS